MSDERLQLEDDAARVDEILRSLTAEDLDVQTPPDSIWAGIEAHLAAAATDDRPLAPVVTLASRRRPAFLAAAIAAALVLVAGLTIAFTGDDDGPVELASAQLVYVDGDPGFVDEGVGRTAAVTLIEDDGREIVRFDAADLPDAGAGNDLEAWVIGVTDGEIQIVQTIGLVADPTAPGTFVLPDDFDRSVYDAVAVDISIEPQDGNADHSGMSLVRGPLVSV